MPNPCTVCVSPSTRWKIKNGYQLWKCVAKSCGHIFVSPAPTQDELTDFYSNSADSQENCATWTVAEDLERNPDAVREFYERTRIRLLRRDGLLHSEKQRIVDIGSATGSFLRSLQLSNYVNLCGVEISQQQAEYCQSSYQIEVFPETSLIQSYSTDLATMYAVLEHFSDPRLVISEVFRILRNGGHLAIDVPNTRSLYQSLTQSHWLWLIPPAHLQYFTPRSLRRLLEDSGFEIVKARTLSTTTYLFIFAHHLAQMFGWKLPNRSITRTRKSAKLIQLAEFMIRLALSPLDLVLRIVKRHNRLVYFAIKQ